MLISRSFAKLTSPAPPIIFTFLVKEYPAILAEKCRKGTPYAYLSSASILFRECGSPHPRRRMRPTTWRICVIFRVFQIDRRGGSRNSFRRSSGRRRRLGRFGAREEIG